MVRRLFAVALGALCGVAQAQPVDYVIDSNHTQPAFEISHLGLSTYRGKFTRAEGRVTLDAQAQRGELRVIIHADSLLTGSPALDQVLLGSDFFAADLYPRITYQSTRIEFDGDRPTRIEGELSLAGKVQPVTLIIDRFACKPHPLLRWREVCGADAHARVSRAAFGMVRYANLVGDEVRLLIPVEATRQ